MMIFFLILSVTVLIVGGIVASCNRKANPTARIVNAKTSPVFVGAKEMFLSNNADFPDQILTSVLSEQNKENPWVVSLEKATQNRTRTVFIGYHDMYVFIGTPYFGLGRIETDYPYPQTSYVRNGGQVFHHTYQNISYANHLGYASIDDYHGVPKHQVLTWIAEDIRTKFQSLHPEMQVSAVKYAKEDPSYYYFTYEVPAAQLTGWK